MTMGRIAKEAGVARNTARKALQNAPGVRPYLRERVLKVAKELDYHPNLVALGLRKSSINLIPMAVNATDNLWFGSLSHHFARKLVGIGMEPALCHNAHHALHVCRSFRARGCLMSVGITPEMKRELGRSCKVVSVGTRHSDLADISVAIDFDPAYRSLAKRLLADGRRRVAVVSDAYVAARAGGWRMEKFPAALRVLEQAGLPLAGGDVFSSAEAFGKWLESKVQGSTGKVQVSSKVEKSKSQKVHLNLEPSLLSLEPCSPVDAVLCENDMVAGRVIAEMGRLGLRTPEDVLVVGCDANFLLPGMWSLKLDAEAVADMAVGLLQKALETDAPVDSIVYKPKWVAAPSAPQFIRKLKQPTGGKCKKH